MFRDRLTMAGKKCLELDGGDCLQEIIAILR